MKHFKDVLNRYKRQLKSASEVYAYKYSFISQDDLYQEALIVLLSLHTEHGGKEETEQEFKDELWLRIRRSFQNNIKREKIINYPLVSFDSKDVNGFSLLETLVGDKDVVINELSIIKNLNLSDTERHVLGLRLQGCTQKEISKITRLHRSTIIKICKGFLEKATF